MLVCRACTNMYTYADKRRTSFKKQLESSQYRQHPANENVSQDMQSSEESSLQTHRMKQNLISLKIMFSWFSSAENF